MYYSGEDCAIAWCRGVVGQAVLARMRHSAQLSKMYLAALACCLLGEPDPGGEWSCQVQEGQRVPPPRPRASSHSTHRVRGERGILYTTKCCYNNALVVLADVFVYLRWHIRASASASATASDVAMPFWSAGRAHATDRDLMSASSAHRKAVVLHWE